MSGKIRLIIGYKCYIMLMILWERLELDKTPFFYLKDCH